jgi:hypothetical protein
MDILPLALSFFPIVIAKHNFFPIVIANHNFFPVVIANHKVVKQSRQMTLDRHAF